MQTIIRWFYTFILILGIPVLVMRLFWKSRKIAGYRHRILERFGIFSPPVQKGGLWLHAVSVGESVAAIPIIQAFQKEFPNIPVMVTTTTPTGSSRVKATFGDKVGHVYFPYDLPIFLNNFFNRVRPEIAVIMETELWPNCLWLCKQRRIPVLIANARLSPRSMQGYRRFRFAVRNMLQCVTVVAAQSQQDGARFIELGLDPSRLIVTGNVKFDVSFSEEVIKAAITLREMLGNSRPIWIAASTHPGEEEQVLAAFETIRKEFPKSLLILVPRHPDRFVSVAELLKKKGHSVISRSSGERVTVDTTVFLGDTMGELGLFYAVSTVAFVGGSLVPVGGHNLLEPAALGVPVITGSYVHNFVDISRLLLDAGALVKVSNSKELAEAVLYWFKNAVACQEAGMRGKQVVAENRGAVEQILNTIKELYEKRY